MTLRNPLVFIPGGNPNIQELPAGDTLGGAAAGTNGTNGMNGGAITIAYTFSTTTTDADPGSGNLRLDNATQNTATHIYADLADANGTDWTSVLDTLDASTNTVKGSVRLVKVGDATKFLVFNVTGRTAATGYRKLTIANTGSSSSSPFSGGDSILLCFDRAGDAGVSGATPGTSLVEKHTASGSASLNFTTGITATYDLYVIEIVGLLAASSGANLIMRCSTNGGSTYDSGSNYSWHRFGFITAGSGTNGSSSDTSIQLKYGLPNSGNYLTYGTFRLGLPSGAYPTIYGHGEGYDTLDAAPSGVFYGGNYLSTTAVNAIQFLMSSGNIASGTIRLYGVSNT